MHCIFGMKGCACREERWKALTMFEVKGLGDWGIDCFVIFWIGSEESEYIWRYICPIYSF